MITMKRFPLFLLLISVVFLSGCSLDESVPVTPKKAPDSLSLDKLSTRETTPPSSVPTPPPPAQTSMPKQYSAVPSMQIDTNKKYTATLHTQSGDIVMDLDVKDTPQTVNNFVFLARDHFYDGTVFHRVIKGFMIQGGDPKGDGTGGPGYTFADEKFTGEYTRGTVAMANAGPNTNGSQFFIMHADYALPKNYVIFGHVTTGMDILDAIAGAPVTSNGNGENSKPVTPVVVGGVDISEE